MCLHHYNCLLFIIIPPVTDVRMMLKKIECVKSLFDVAEEGLSEGHLFLFDKGKEVSRP